MKKLLEEAHIKFAYVPAGCTDELQRLDKSFNAPYKNKLKQYFTTWYANQVKHALKKKEQVKINLQTSVIKELYANWIMKTHCEKEKKEDLIKMGFEQTGIYDTIH